MENQSVEKIISATHTVRTMAAIALGMLALFLLVGTVSELRSIQYIGAGIAATDTITVSGEGKVFTVPDTATFTYTVDETAPDVATAQSKATTASNTIIDYLKSQGIADTDIQTTDYNVNPQYQYNSQICTQNGYCPPQRQTISGYEVSQTETVKVKDISKAGALLSGVGTRGVSDVSGLTFTVENQDALDAQARGKAIADAKSKAQALASSLGVSLVRITGFSEDSGGTRIPMYMQASDAMASSAGAPAVPTIATGQNTIISDVSVTYEIR
ncbi:MAG TPA: SIMPL domain-containing protein [Candidatus Paceibacterota bacterium]|nr:SIMPL domain-containing protein [Candidatus Paceibacterota bacterium]